MCKRGNTEILGISGVPRDIDSCIVSLVKALNEAGFETVACCCGHGKILGNIALKDGRELFISPSYEESRRIELQRKAIFRDLDMDKVTRNIIEAQDEQAAELQADNERKTKAMERMMHFINDACADIRQIKYSHPQKTEMTIRLCDDALSRLVLAKELEQKP